MNLIKIFTAIIFSLIILVPAVTFNFTPNTASVIDNRMLAENPFSQGPYEDSDEFTAAVESYVNDRIGLRDEMILAYTVLNDKLFGKMVHPNYAYGKDGYVFGQGLSTVEDGYYLYHEAFADMIEDLQEYCEARDIPFLFVLNPAKPAVLTEYIPSGINYDRSWMDEFFDALDERGIRYLDNTVTLREKTEEGEVVFNQKYDANHWNDLGAYCGTNAILQELQEDFPKLELNDIEDFTVSEVLQTSLPVSQFPIDELVPEIEIGLDELIDNTELFKDEIEMDPSYQTFGYYENPEKIEDGSPSALVFQGSYMNNYGYKYLENAFGEYVYVHDYQNVFDLDYYFNIFKPDCVIFEMAEYTFSDIYFEYDKMMELDMNPTISEIESWGLSEDWQVLDTEDIYVENKEELTRIFWDTDDVFQYVWVTLDGEEYDMIETETGYELTLLTENYSSDMNIEIIAYDGSSIIIYQ